MKKCTDPKIPMEPQEALNILNTKLNAEGPITIVIDEIRARIAGVKALKKQIPKGHPAQFDSESLNCGNCGNDVENAIENNFYFCPYCGQRLRDGENASPEHRP